MIRDHNIDLLELGMNAAKIFSARADKMTVYEKGAAYLYENLIAVVGHIRLYLIDNKEEIFKEEIVYNYEGLISGYDFIPFYQLPNSLMKDHEIVQYYDNDILKLLVPLSIDEKILGLIDFKMLVSIDEEDINNISKMADLISLGLFYHLYDKNQNLLDTSADMVLEIINKLQNIKDQNILVSVFMNLVLRKFKFDRVSIFLFNEENKVTYGKCINTAGKEFLVEQEPDIPQFNNDYKALKNTKGYWFSLKTNTRTVGAILFDNLYSLYKISESTIDILRILCSHFASAIENIRLFADLQRAALYDKLTGLHNRRYFEKLISEFSQLEKSAVSIIVGDVNGLKVTNDVFGHQAGDDLLKTVADILKSVSSPKDVLVRWGGDEFVLLLSNTSKEKAQIVYEQIKEKCNKNSSTEVKISIALGIASCKSNNENIKKVLNRAEDRMYHNKLRETKEFRDSLINSLIDKLGEKCTENTEHARRMSKLSYQVGEKMGLTKHELSNLKMLAIIHDIGKVSISREILNKKGPLSSEEWEEVKKHSEAGYRIAHESFELSSIANYILSHHERWDGQGYPLGKKASDIPRLSRIIAVVDAYDVMTNNQPYKKAISHQEAIKEIKINAGSQFDPDIAKLFCELLQD